jgi:hypothetical protein
MPTVINNLKAAVHAKNQMPVQGVAHFGFPAYEVILSGAAFQAKRRACPELAEGISVSAGLSREPKAFL